MLTIKKGKYFEINFEGNLILLIVLVFRIKTLIKMRGG